MSVDPALVAQILAATAGKPLLKQLPCGCQMGTVDDAFVYRPCSPTCEYWLHVRQEAKRQGKPLAYGWDGDRN